MLVFLIRQKTTKLTKMIAKTPGNPCPAALWEKS